MSMIGVGRPRTGRLLSCVLGVMFVLLRMVMLSSGFEHSLYKVVRMVFSVNSCGFSSGYRSQSMMSLPVRRLLGNECISDWRCNRAWLSALFTYALYFGNGSVSMYSVSCVSGGDRADMYIGNRAGRSSVGSTSPSSIAFVLFSSTCGCGYA